jgi:hypothetical protein
MLHSTKHNGHYLSSCVLNCTLHLRLSKQGFHYHNPHPLNCLVSQKAHIFVDTLIITVQPPVGDGPISPPAWDTREIRVGYNNSQYYRSRNSGSRNARNTNLTFICLPPRVIQNMYNGNENIIALRNRFRVFESTHKVQNLKIANHSSSRSSSK